MKQPFGWKSKPIVTLHGVDIVLLKPQYGMNVYGLRSKPFGSRTVRNFNGLREPLHHWELKRLNIGRVQEDDIFAFIRAHHNLSN